MSDRQFQDVTFDFRQNLANVIKSDEFLMHRYHRKKNINIQSWSISLLVLLNKKIFFKKTV